MTPEKFRNRYKGKTRDLHFLCLEAGIELLEKGELKVVPKSKARPNKIILEFTSDEMASIKQECRRTNRTLVELLVEQAASKSEINRA